MFILRGTAGDRRYATHYSTLTSVTVRTYVAASTVGVLHIQVTTTGLAGPVNKMFTHSPTPCET